MKPQTELVLRLLRERGSLTPLEALDAGAGLRLAARVDELRKEFGVGAIAMKKETYGGASYARYYWKGGRAQTELAL